MKYKIIMIDIRKYYNKKIIELEDVVTTQVSKLRLLGFARLILFICIILSVFILIPKSIIVGIIASVILTVLFLSIIKIHNSKKNKNLHTKTLIAINKSEVKALDHDYSGFESGKEYIDPEHPYSFDMDLFGEGSVFQYLNRTVTAGGKESLFQLLSEETIDKEAIADRKEAIQELSKSLKHIQDFRASGLLHIDKTIDSSLLKEWINRPVHFLLNKGMLFIAKALPAAVLLSIILAIFLPALKGIPIVLFLINLLIIATKFSQISKEHSLISKHLEALKKYAFLLSIIEKGSYSCKKLKGLYKVLITGSSSAAKSILSLSKIVSAFDSRLNIIAAIILEGLFLWDIQCMLRLEKWRKTDGLLFDEWMNKLAEFDSLASLSTFAFNHPFYVYPEFSSTKILDANQTGHFLIPSGQRVCNDFLIEKQGDFIIITGANMAGKSTFLRTVVTNLVMAMTGAPVCAKSFIFKPVRIFSSMRTSDSLNKNESYFYAELKRLKEMLDRLKKGDNLFIILDEILKGTNSIDKQKGSRAALKQILKYNGTGIIATHDLELAGIESEMPERIKNLCFEIEINKTDISFDYMLKKGITTKMNASLLMQQMGIIEE